MRIDQLNSEGAVTSRTETPFQKETAEVAIKMAALQNDNGKTEYKLRFEQEEAVKKALGYFEQTDKGDW